MESKYDMVPVGRLFSFEEWDDPYVNLHMSSDMDSKINEIITKDIESGINEFVKLKDEFLKNADKKDQ